MEHRRKESQQEITGERANKRISTTGNFDDAASKSNRFTPEDVLSAEKTKGVFDAIDSCASRWRRNLMGRRVDQCSRAPDDMGRVIQKVVCVSARFKKPKLTIWSIEEKGNQQDITSDRATNGSQQQGK